MEKYLLGFTSVGIILYWGLVFTNIFPVTELIPGYKNWFISFPLADLWIAIACALALYWFTNILFSSVFQIAAGSELIFLGLYALLYGINTGLIFQINTEEIIEIAIKIYCLIVGSYFIFSGYNRLQNLIK